MAYNSLVTKTFDDIPWIGTMPVEINKVKMYNLKPYLPADKKVSEVLIYCFFSSLPRATKGPVVCSVYELYTTTDEGTPHYSQLMNATFNQPDTSDNSANIWMPYTDGLLRAYLPEEWVSGPIPKADADQLKAHKFKNLNETMKAFAEKNDHTLFCEIFLLGYRLTE